MSEPKISVIVCTYNRAGLLSECLNSLVEQNLDKRSYEVIVVDNNSTDETQGVAKTFVRKYPNFRLVVEQIQGLSHARNRGWMEARGKYVAYIDDDAKATFEWCERIKQAFEKVIPQPSAVGGEINPFYEIAPPEWFLDDFETRTWGKEAGFLKSPCAKFGFSGSNMAFPRELLKEYGGFSIDFGMEGSKMRMGEETELFSRIYESQPFFWYDPAIRVLHWVPKNKMQFKYQIYRYFRCGQALASIEGRQFTFKDCIKGLASVCISTVKTLFLLLKSGKNIKTEAMKGMQELGSKVGYLARHK